MRLHHHGCRGLLLVIGLILSFYPGGAAHAGVQPWTLSDRAYYQQLTAAMAPCFAAWPIIAKAGEQIVHHRMHALDLSHAAATGYHACWPGTVGQFDPHNTPKRSAINVRLYQAADVWMEETAGYCTNTLGTLAIWYGVRGANVDGKGALRNALQVWPRLLRDYHTAQKAIRAARAVYGH